MQAGESAIEKAW